MNRTEWENFREVAEREIDSWTPVRDPDWEDRRQRMMEDMNRVQQVTQRSQNAEVNARVDALSSEPTGDDAAESGVPLALRRSGRVPNNPSVAQYRARALVPPPAVGTGAVGVSLRFAREDHTHDSDTEPALLDFPIITYPDYVLGKKETATPGVYEIGWVEVTDCEGGSS